MDNNSFLISPMSQRINLKPGEVYSGTIQVTNPVAATKDFSYKVRVSPYGVNGEQYDADLQNTNGRSLVAGWIEIENGSGTLTPNETKEVNYTITVPENVPVGAQYAAIIVSENNEKGPGSGMAVENVFEMASIIYANIDGEMVHDAHILDNQIPGFSNSAIVTVSARVDNKGNTYEDAIVSISAKNAITGESLIPNDDSSGRYSELIMPETTRLIERNLDGLPALGIVHVEQTIYYNGETSLVEGNIVICPLWFIVLVALGFVALIGLVTRIIWKHKHKPTVI